MSSESEAQVLEDSWGPVANNEKNPMNSFGYINNNNPGANKLAVSFAAQDQNVGQSTNIFMELGFLHIFWNGTRFCI